MGGYLLPGNDPVGRSRKPWELTIIIIIIIIIIINTNTNTNF